VRKPSVSPFDVTLARTPARKAPVNAEDVRVKAMGVHDLDWVSRMKSTRRRSCLTKLEIVEASERVFVDLSDAQLVSFGAQRTAILQAGEMNAAFPAVMQLGQELHGLALACTLLETIDDEQDVWLHR